MTVCMVCNGEGVICSTCCESENACACTETKLEPCYECKGSGK